MTIKKLFVEEVSIQEMNFRLSPETKLNIKAFLWDQLVRPTYLLFNTSFIKMLFLAMIFASIIFFNSTLLFIIFTILTMLVYIYDLVKYYRSGEYKANYRKYKYGDYKKAIKEIKKSNQTHTLVGPREQQEEILSSSQPSFETPADSVKEVKDGEQTEQ